MLLAAETTEAPSRVKRRHLMASAQPVSTRTKPPVVKSHTLHAVCSNSLYAHQIHALKKHPWKDY